MDFKTIVIYAVIVIVIAAAVAFVFSKAIPHSYGVTVSLSSNSTTARFPYQTSYFIVKVNNTGTSTITSMPVLLYVNGNPTGSYKVTLPPGKGGIILWNYTYTTNGTYQFQAIADPAHLLQITNRTSSQGSITVNITQLQRSDVYSTFPNANITDTGAFSLFQNGPGALALIGLAYNTSIANGMLGPTRTLIVRTLDDLSSTINWGAGATAYYNDGSEAYTLWLQGTLNPSVVEFIVNSFSLPEKSVEFNGTTATYVKDSNTTSMCFYYSGGWTKILSYYNASNGMTCESFLGTVYNESENTTIANGYNSSGLESLSANFIYTNSSVLGISRLLGNGSFSTTTMFSNPYGVFLSYLSNAKTTIAPGENLTCYGVVYLVNGTSVCSSYLYPKFGSGINIGMLNQTITSRNYTASLFSLVNSTYVSLANQNGLHLLSKLGIPGTLNYTQSFVNTCSLANASLSCGLAYYSLQNNTAVLKITNNLKSSILLNNLACFITGADHPQEINQSLAPGASLNITTTCYNVPVPVLSATTTYALSVNYTVSGTAYTDFGTVNVTNLAV